MNRLYFGKSALPLHSEDIEYLQDNIEDILERNFSQLVSNNGVPSVVSGFTVEADAIDSYKFNVIGTTSSGSGGLCDASGKLYTTNNSWTSQSFTTNYADTVPAVITAGNCYAIYAIVSKTYGSYDRTSSDVVLNSKLAIDMSTYTQVYDRSVDTISIVSQQIPALDSIVTSPQITDSVSIELARCKFDTKTTFSIYYDSVKYTKTRLTANTITESELSKDISIPQTYVSASKSTTFPTGTTLNTDNSISNPDNLQEDIDNIKSNIKSIKGTSTWDSNNHGTLANLDPAVNAVHQNGILSDSTGTLDVSITAQANTIQLKSGKYLFNGTVVVNPDIESFTFDVVPTTQYSNAGALARGVSFNTIYSATNPYVFPEFSGNKYDIGDVYITPTGGLVKYVEDSSLSLHGDYRFNSGRAYVLVANATIENGSNVCAPTASKSSYSLGFLIDGSLKTATIPLLPTHTWDIVISNINTAFSGYVKCEIEPNSKVLKFTNVSRSGGLTISYSIQGVDDFIAFIFGGTPTYYICNKNSVTPLATNTYNGVIYTGLAGTEASVFYSYAYRRYDAIVCKKVGSANIFGISKGIQSANPIPPYATDGSEDILYVVNRDPFANIESEDIIDCRTYVKSVSENRTFYTTLDSIINTPISSSLVPSFTLNKYKCFDNSDNYHPLEDANLWKLDSVNNCISTNTASSYITFNTYSKLNDQLWMFFDIGEVFNKTLSVTVSVCMSGSPVPVASKNISLYSPLSCTKSYQYIMSDLPAGNITINIKFVDASALSSVKFYGLTIGKLDRSIGALSNRLLTTAIDKLSTISCTADSIDVKKISVGDGGISATGLSSLSNLITTGTNKLSGLSSSTVGIVQVSADGILSKVTAIPVSVLSADGLTSASKLTAIGTSAASSIIVGNTTNQSTISGSTVNLSSASICLPSFTGSNSAIVTIGADGKLARSTALPSSITSAPYINSIGSASSLTKILGSNLVTPGLIKTDGAGNLTIVNSLITKNVKKYAVNGTYDFSNVITEDVTFIHAVVIGAGGSGSCSGSNSEGYHLGRGGDSGAIMVHTFNKSEFNNKYTLTVGAGGTGTEFNSVIYSAYGNGGGSSRLLYLTAGGGNYGSLSNWKDLTYIAKYGIGFDVGDYYNLKGCGFLGNLGGIWKGNSDLIAGASSGIGAPRQTTSEAAGPAGAYGALGGILKADGSDGTTPHLGAGGGGGVAGVNSGKGQNGADGVIYLTVY